MDPMTAISTAGLALQFSGSFFKACQTLYTFFKDVQGVAETARELAGEIHALEQACRTVNSLVKSLAPEQFTQQEENTEMRELFGVLEQQLQKCDRTIKQLQSAISCLNVNSEDKSNLFQDALRQIKLKLKASDIESVRTRIKTHTNSLQITLGSLNM